MYLQVNCFIIHRSMHLFGAKQVPSQYSRPRSRTVDVDANEEHSLVWKYLNIDRICINLFLWCFVLISCLDDTVCVVLIACVREISLVSMLYQMWLKLTFRSHFTCLMHRNQDTHVPSLFEFLYFIFYCVENYCFKVDSIVSLRQMYYIEIAMETKLRFHEHSFKKLEIS